MWSKGRIKSIAGITVSILLLVFVLFAVKGAPGSGVKGRLQSIASIVAKPVNSVAHGIKTGFRGIFRFKQITAENEALKGEVEELQWENAVLVLEKKEKEELEELREIFGCEELENRHVAAANIAAVDYSGWQGVFTIDKGSKDGVNAGCAVVSGRELIGKVAEVSEHTSKVASLLAETSKVSFQISGKKGVAGVLQSNGAGGLEGYLLEEGETVKKGDELFTSGVGTYPAGLEIGKVTHVEKKKGTQRMLIEAQPAVSFFNLTKVAVIL